MKKQGCFALLMILSSLLVSLLDTTEPFLHMIKCVLMAYGITMLGYAACKRHIQKKHSVLYVFGVLLLVVYALLALDTHLFHIMTWFPGIVRYALFSTYGVWYILFLIPGALLCFEVE